MASLSKSTMQHLTVQGLGEETDGFSLGKGGGLKPSTLKKEVLLPGPGPYRVPVRELAPISVLPPNHTESLVDL